MTLDKATKDWLTRHWQTETTMCICEKCGKAYKPSLGHDCKEGEE